MDTSAEAEALEKAVQLTGHARFRALLDPAHPRFNPAYGAVVRRLAEEGRPQPKPYLGQSRRHHPGVGTAGPQSDATCDLVIRAYLSSWNGYGRHAEHLSRALERAGVRVGFDPTAVDESYAPLPDWVKERIGRRGPKRLTLAPPDRNQPAADAWFTMWESTRLPSGAAERLNATAPLVIVPCRANVEWFRASGVTVPIAVAPEAVTTPGIAPTPLQMDGPTVFGAAGRMAHGGARKGLNEVMSAFTAAFLAGENVRLEVKCWPDCLPQLRVPADPRIRLLTESWDDRRLAEWYSSLTCYVTASKGEGWGLHTHEAMAAGRPCIAASWGGTADFFDGRFGWELAYDLTPASAFYSGCGEWAVPRESSLVAALWQCHARRDLAARRGEAAAVRAAEFTHDRGAQAVIEAMGLLPSAPAPAPSTGGSELEALAIVARCPHARVCGCASRGNLDCQPGGKRPGQRVTPATCRECLAGSGA